MGLNKNASYKLYTNSNLESRGVAIAIKRSIVHEILDEYKSNDQNILLMKVKIKGCEIILGSIYGPNENDPQFYRNLRLVLERWNSPFIIGGDFNTVLDTSINEQNLDMIGGGRRPNPRNADEINRWISEGNCIEPFRALYPEQKEVSYIPFRVVREEIAVTGKSRLDFFLIHENILRFVNKVKYNEKLSHDFDHKMVSLYVGKTGKPSNTKIFNDTLNHNLAGYVGKIAIMDALLNHLSERNENWCTQVGRLMNKSKELLDLELLNLRNNINPILAERIQNLHNEIGGGLIDCQQSTH